MVALVPQGGDLDTIESVARRRFGASPVVGNAAELIDDYGRLDEQGIGRVYTWFCDFAPPETLLEFGETVIAPLARSLRSPAPGTP